MHRLHERAANRLLRHDDASWMELVHQLVACTCDPASGCPVVVVVQPTHDRKRDHLVACRMRGHGWSAWVRNLLPNALMRPCPVEVVYIRIEHALELPLMKDQQVIDAFLPHTSQEALADGVGSWLYWLLGTSVREKIAKNDRRKTKTVFF